MESEDLLFKAVGAFGRYQIIQYFIVSLNSFFEVDILYFNFISYSPHHWCKVDFNDHRQNLTAVEKRNFTIPWDDNHNRYSQCLQYSIYKNDTSIGANDTSATAKCDSWHYDNSLYEHTTVTEWDLVCDREWMVDFLPTVHVLGILIGSMIASMVSDRFGRWLGTLIFLVIKTFSNILSMVAPSVEVLFVARFFLGIGGIGAYLDSFVLLLETTSPKHRTWMGSLLPITFSMGSMALAGLAYLVRHWRNLQIGVVVGTSLVMFMTAFLMYESPRWLMQRGEKEKAIKILKKIGKRNKRPYSDKVEAFLDGHMLEREKQPESKMKISKLCESATVRKYTVISAVAWFCASLLFYALSINAKSLSGNIFLNFFLLSMIEVPANLVAFVCLRSRLGRRFTLVMAFMVAGIACFVSIPLLIIYGKSSFTTALAITGKFGGTVAFTGVYIYTAELFPTEIRNVAVGVSSLSSRMGALLGTYAGGSMGNIWTPLPSLLFGIAGTLSGFLILLLPETRGTVLKDTVHEQEVADHKKNEDVYTADEDKHESLKLAENSA